MGFPGIAKTTPYCCISGCKNPATHWVLAQIKASWESAAWNEGQVMACPNHAKLLQGLVIGEPIKLWDDKQTIVKVTKVWRDKTR